MSITTSFKKFITEAILSSGAEKAGLLITKYLKKKTGLSFFAYPGVEQFQNTKGRGFGMRFFSNKKNMSIRLNWSVASQTGSLNLSSVDYWNGVLAGDKCIPYHIEFDTSVSMVKVLPTLADIINAKTPKLGPIRTVPDGVPLTESTQYDLTEAVDGPEEMFDAIVDMFPLDSFSKGKVYGKFKGAGAKILSGIEDAFPDLIYMQGTRYVWAGNAKDLAKIKKSKSEILDEVGAVSGTISRGSGAEEKYFGGNVEALEANRERISFEAQLVDLENLVKLIISGASNALFVSGRGGVGKTHTTEKILAQMGLRDGDGYFKNTGSASASGLYSLLFKYKNDIIFFDDSDSALDDQESRNILKAATDTKKIRKLVWNKAGKNIADPGEMTDEEILNNGMIPRYFEFTGKIIFISNLKLDKLDPDGALRTRAYIIDIDPTDEEVYDFMEKILNEIELEGGLRLDSKSRKHVLTLIKNGKSKQDPNLRKLSRGLNMYAGHITAGVEVSDEDLERMIRTYA